MAVEYPHMATKRKSALKRELKIGAASYILTIAPDGFKLVPKGKRKGYEMSWKSLVSGDAALAVALHASLGLAHPPKTSGGKAQRKY